MVFLKIKKKIPQPHSRSKETELHGLSHEEMDMAQLSQISLQARLRETILMHLEIHLMSQEI